MLRITTSDIGEKVTLKLEGKLSGPWVEEFERCWHMSSDIYKNKGLVVDLSGVTFVDAAGKKLLCSISSAGAQLVGSGLMPKSLIDEICVEKPPAKPGKAPHKLKQEAAHLLLILLLPFLVAARTRAEDRCAVATDVARCGGHRAQGKSAGADCHPELRREPGGQIHCALGAASASRPGSF